MFILCLFPLTFECRYETVRIHAHWWHHFKVVNILKDKMKRSSLFLSNKTPKCMCTVSIPDLGLNKSFWGIKWTWIISEKCWPTPKSKRVRAEKTFVDMVRAGIQLLYNRFTKGYRNVACLSLLLCWSHSEWSWINVSRFTCVPFTWSSKCCYRSWVVGQGTSFTAWVRTYQGPDVMF